VVHPPSSGASDRFETPAWLTHGSDDAVGLSIYNSIISQGKCSMNHHPLSTAISVNPSPNSVALSFAEREAFYHTLIIVIHTNPQKCTLLFWFWLGNISLSLVTILNSADAFGILWNLLYKSKHWWNPNKSIPFPFGITHSLFVWHQLFSSSAPLNIRTIPFAVLTFIPASQNFYLRPTNKDGKWTAFI
jgi:hypothetical protein